MIDIIGSVSTATMRPEDLIPTFIGVLDDLIEAKTFEPGADALEHVTAAGKLHDVLGDIERRLETLGYFDSMEAAYDLEWLFDALDELAPEGVHFGAHEGDGADYGFWENEPEEEEAQ